MNKLNWIIAIQILLTIFFFGKIAQRRYFSTTLEYSPVLANLVRDEYPSLVQGDYLNTDSCRKITSLALNLHGKRVSFEPFALNLFANLDTLVIYGYQKSMVILPVLPNHIRVLRMLHGRCSVLPKLPQNLTELSVWDNGLTRLPAELPVGLKTLICQHNQLTELPDDLPTGLKWVNCSNNSIFSLVELPNSIEYLDCSNNSIEHLICPTELKLLDCSFNKIKTLDINGKLEQLKASNNPLENIYGYSNSIMLVEIENTRMKCLPQALRSFYKADEGIGFCP